MSTPILSKQFFSAHPPNAGFFSKWRANAPWAENCLPIYEWQGVLFVGCLFVPENFPKFTEQVVFVLCDQESLKSVWYDYQGTVVAKPQIPFKPAPLDMPSGLMEYKGPSAAPEISMDALGVVEEKTPAESPEVDLSAETTEVELLSLAPELPPAPTGTAIKIEPLKPKMESLLPTIEAIPKIAPTIPKVVPMRSVDHSDQSEVTKRSVQTLQVSSKPSLNAFVTNLYQEMGFFFLKSMILLKDGDSMKPWNWDSNFHALAASEGISLAIPSPWRIVMTTQKPYHGYLAPNEISERFFDNWNDSQTPEHMTLYPIVIQEHVIGMIMGIGEKSADNKTSLQLTQRWAHAFEKQIQSQPDFCKVS